MRVRPVPAIRLLILVVGLSAIVPRHSTQAAPTLSVPVPIPNTTSNSTPIAPLAQATPSASDIATACAQNQADRLPNPYVDVPANHWAYRAVLTLYYCEPVRITPLPTPAPGPNS